MPRIELAARQFVTEETGATMVEYAIMVALIAAVCFLAVQTVGTKVGQLFTNTNTAMP